MASNPTPAMNDAISRNIDVLVIGAGMTGISAASALRKAGRENLVVDKGRGVGGRMATRRAGGAVFDHGAQFVTARDSRFEAVLKNACIAGAAMEWCREFAAETDGHPRWRGVPGMSSLAKHMALGLEVVLEKQVTAVQQMRDHWSVRMHEADHLKGVSAAPAVTIHANHAFSVAHWDQDRDEAGRLLLEAAGDWLGVGIQSFQVHGWRYSKPMVTDPLSCAIVSSGPLLVLAGDVFAGPRVEGAALSGWAAAEVILNAGARLHGSTTLIKTP
jgi:predicted NAD/FAD-dependent oxidoreductase